MWRNQPRWVVWLVIGLVAMAVLGFFPILAQREGMPFLPAPGFVAVAEWPVVALGLLASGGVVLVTAHQTAPAERRSWLRDPKSLLPGFLAALIFVALPVYMTLLVTVPLLVTAVAGRPVAAEYIVKYDNPRLRGKRVDCYPAVAVAGMPFLYNRACHLPEAVQSALDPGDTIVLEGRGGALGVYYSTARLR